MQPFWVTLQAAQEHSPSNLGVGVTARSEADARHLIQLAFPRPTLIASIKPVTDMRELDQKHVVSNMGNWFERGVWFPLGYDYVRD